MNGGAAPESSGGKSLLKTNLVLGGVLVALSFGVYWYEFRGKRDLEKRREASNRLAYIDPNAEVEFVRFVNSDRATDIEIRCKEKCTVSNPESPWEIVKPFAFKADSGNLGSFVTSVSAAEIFERVPMDDASDAKLGEFGLTKQKRESHMAILKLKGQEKPYTFYVGDAAPVGDNVFVMMDGPGVSPESASKPTVFVVSVSFKNHIEKSLSYWRDKRLLSYAKGSPTEIDLKNASGLIRLIRHPDIGWVLEPGKRMADQEAVETFLTGLLYMSAHEYVSDQLDLERAKLGLNKPPHYALRVKTLDGREQKMDLWDVLIDKTPKVYAAFQGSKTVFELDRTHIEKFSKKEDSFRFRNLLTASQRDLTRKIEWRAGDGKTYLFSRAAPTAKWEVEGAAPERFDADLVTQGLTKLGVVRVAEFQGRKPIPATAKRLSSWKLSRADHSTIVALEFWGGTGQGEYYAKLQTGETVKLEAGSAAAVPGKTTDFQKPEPQRTEAKH